MSARNDRLQQVTIELMRPGDLGGQLLSKLTSYLAVSDDSHAETIHLPFDHWELLQDLRMLSQNRASHERDHSLLALGKRVRDFMERLSLLPGALRTHTDGGRPVHLRLALSGHELALIPYEAGLGPSPPYAEAEPLLAHPNRQVILTRELRQSSTMPLDWSRPPRVLLVGAEPEPYSEVPLRAHALSLYQALQPFEFRRSRYESAGRDASSMLTILSRATLAEIHSACATATPPFTHVVLLAHGVALRSKGMTQYGVALHSEHGDLDVVDSVKLRNALRPIHSDGRRVTTPTMLVMMMCHSGAQGDVVLPVGSLAHELHAAGIPWVLASQFPLSKTGSVTISRELFPSLFLGDDPRLVLHKVRQMLRLPSGHPDWASLVAYAAIPPGFERQVQLARRRAADLACSVLFNEIDTEANPVRDGASSGQSRRELTKVQRQKYESLVNDYAQRILDTQPVQDTPETAPDRAEVFGMLGGIERNRAFLLDVQVGMESTRISSNKLRTRLAAARNYYAKARTLWSEFSWNTVHYLSLTAQLGEPFPMTAWAAAIEVAGAQVQSPNSTVRDWGHVALHELFLLALSRPDRQRQILCSLAGGKSSTFLRKQAEQQFKTIVMSASPDSDVIRKVKRQLRRYLLTMSENSMSWRPSLDFQDLVRKQSAVLARKPSVGM